MKRERCWRRRAPQAEIPGAEVGETPPRGGGVVPFYGLKPGEGAAQHATGQIAAQVGVILDRPPRDEVGYETPWVTYWNQVIEGAPGAGSGVRWRFYRTQPIEETMREGGRVAERASR